MASFYLELKQLDIKTAFLHDDLDEQTFMEQPRGSWNPEQTILCVN